MLKILAFLTKRQDLETKAFLEHYETKHIPLICSLAPAPLVYKRSYLMRGDALNLDDGSVDFDVVTELVPVRQNVPTRGLPPGRRRAWALLAAYSGAGGAGPGCAAFHAAGVNASSSGLVNTPRVNRGSTSAR